MTWPICLHPPPSCLMTPCRSFCGSAMFSGLPENLSFSLGRQSFKEKPTQGHLGMFDNSSSLVRGWAVFSTPPAPQISPYPSSLSLTIALGFKRLQTRSSSGHTHNVDLIRSYSDANRAILALKHWCIFPGTDTIGFDFLAFFPPLSHFRVLNITCTPSEMR